MVSVVVNGSSWDFGSETQVYTNYDAVNLNKLKSSLIDTTFNGVLQVDSDSWSELSSIFTKAGFNCSKSSSICSISADKTSCANVTSNMSDLSIVLGDYAFVIPPMGQVQSSKNSFDSTATCVLGITGGAADKTLNIGMQFMASFYTEFAYNVTSSANGHGNKTTESSVSF